MVDRQPVPKVEPFAFGGEFQRAIFRLFMDDAGFAATVVPYIRPTYFENEILGWLFSFGAEYYRQYSRWPSFLVYRHALGLVDTRNRPLFEAVVDQIAALPMVDAQWLRDQVLDFVKRSIFVKTMHESRALYNANNVAKAYDLFMARLEEIQRLRCAVPDESDFFESLPNRHNERMSGQTRKHAVGTALPTLDDLLGGGLSPGELGIVIAYPKCGKSTFLLNMGVAATRSNYRRVAHFVFEGQRERIEDRYDAVFMGELYQNVKRGDLSDVKKYSEAYALYQNLRGLLKIRGYTDRWDYSVLDIDNDLRRWEREQGWTPELLVVDYGDLIGGRAKSYDSEQAKQRAAFRDLKTLANRGYAVWTASQAQRPADGAEDKPHEIRSRQIADCFDKVRVADLLCSQNVTREERRHQQARLFLELYRENDAERVIPLECDFSRMSMREAPRLGYVKPTVVGGKKQQQRVNV